MTEHPHEPPNVPAPQAPQIIMTGASTSVRATTIDNYSVPENH